MTITTPSSSLRRRTGRLQPLITVTEHSALQTQRLPNADDRSELTEARHLPRFAKTQGHVFVTRRDGTVLELPLQEEGGSRFAVTARPVTDAGGWLLLGAPHCSRTAPSPPLPQSSQSREMPERRVLAPEIARKKSPSKILANDFSKGNPFASGAIHSAPGSPKFAKHLLERNLELTAEAQRDPVLAGRPLPHGSWPVFPPGPDGMLPPAWRGVTPPSHPEEPRTTGDWPQTPSNQQRPNPTRCGS